MAMKSLCLAVCRHVPFHGFKPLVVQAWSLCVSGERRYCSEGANAISFRKIWAYLQILNSFQAADSRQHTLPFTTLLKGPSSPKFHPDIDWTESQGIEGIIWEWVRKRKVYKEVHLLLWLTVSRGWMVFWGDTTLLKGSEKGGRHLQMGKLGQFTLPFS